MQADNELKRAVDSIENDNQNTWFVSGKISSDRISFLKDLERKFEFRKDWIIVQTESSESLLKILVNQIYQRRKSCFTEMLAHLKGVSLSESGLSIQPEVEDKSYQYQILLQLMLEELKKRNIRVLIVIEEIKDMPELREFAALYQLLLRTYDISLVMSGRSEEVYKLQNEEYVTFLLRAGRVEL